MVNDPHKSVYEIILNSILRNFSGKKDIQETLMYFKKSFGVIQLEDFYEEHRHELNPTKLIYQNLQDRNCRNIMLFVDNFEHAIDYAESLCNKQRRSYRTF